MNSLLHKKNPAAKPVMFHAKSKPFVQTKLTVNEPGDIYEQEADAMADRVMRMSTHEPIKPVTGLIGKSLQRKCAHCEEEEKRRKPLMRKTESGYGGMQVSDSFAPSLNASEAGGSPLPQGTRSYMENAFSTDFSRVRVHTDGQAAAMSKGINAKAFTHGSSIYFNSGQFDVGSIEGKKLLAHELTHVVQQVHLHPIQRQPDDQATDSPEAKKSRTVDLKYIIEDKFQETAAIKGELLQISDPHMDELRLHLKEQRQDMIALLEERIALLSDLLTLEEASTEEVTDWLNELQLSEQMLVPLKRWEKRQLIENINDRLAAIDDELSKEGSCYGMGEVLMLERQALSKEKRQLAKELTSTAVEYKQFDSRWGKEQYGKASGCSTVGESACGPTSLAMVLNFYELENPEGLASTGSMEIVLPSETVAYAEKHGRICGSGTNSVKMMKGVPDKWEGYRGIKIELQDVIKELENGRLVIFSCHDCKGKNAKGETKTYGKHYMVLNGVDEAGQIFNVLDSGRAEKNNIETIDLKNLQTKVPIFWKVDYKE